MPLPVRPYAPSLPNDRVWELSLAMHTTDASQRAYKRQSVGYGEHMSTGHLDKNGPGQRTASSISSCSISPMIQSAVAMGCQSSARDADGRWSGHLDPVAVSW